MSKIIDWEPIKTDYMTRNMRSHRTEPYSLKELATNWKVSYKSIRNRASRERWSDELRQRISEQNKRGIDLIQERESINEVEVRTRQADAAREMLELALAKLRTLRPQDLSKREAIELLKIGLGEERRALGLADKFELKAHVNTQERFSPVEEMIKGQQSIEVLAMRVLTTLKAVHNS